MVLDQYQAQRDSLLEHNLFLYAMKRPQTFPLNDANSAAQEEFVGEDANLAQRPLNVGVRVHEWGLNPLFWVSRSAKYST